MAQQSGLVGRREKAMADKRKRIMDAARSLFAERGMGHVTTQEVSDRADVAIGTLFRYAATKAELLIMVQNEKFRAAIDEGLAASGSLSASDASTEDAVMALLSPVIDCVREQPENGRRYLHELVFGDPVEEHRSAGLAEAWRFEAAIADLLRTLPDVDQATRVTLARVITSIIHVTMTATLHLGDTPGEVTAIVRSQLAAVLRGHERVGS
ncbi:TetR/AcrR family transcriptional regulator [Microbacterium sp. VKM Ac-2923]|uniref:TetR/AcrR family transcriptional regulator n=1 Tax=Microbacterium sp. VKM Ac-2923 TaxID=2929476 RepID=UPI001FB53C4E|nr:TetR/AcrR family transcriptional regulator [Microbacterium sp. VKM Ac-2923]MCJ1708855.1 TetR/AcrR family transcriptional regulator [Microbacterium sp. VKM Ac-2923]